MSDGVYHCRMCNEMFKTTADLQKHKRMSHRSSRGVPGTPRVEKPKFGGVEVKEEQETTMNNSGDLVIVEEEEGHGHETRSKRKNNDRQEGEVALEKERHVNCSACGEDFDTKDDVILHLLRQSISAFGVVKCPVCGKTMENLMNGPSFAGNTSKGSLSTASTATDIVNVKGNLIESLIHVARKTLSAPTPARPQRKRKLSSSQTSEGTAVKSKRRSSMMRQEKPTGSYSAVTPTSVKLEQGSVPSPLVAVQTDQLQHVYEATYRQPRGKGSRGGSSVGRRSSGVSRANEDTNSNPSDSPLKVSVLINNNPYPSEKRLAVPKGKHFQKGDIRCPYCGFEAATVREIQFHVNTHMPKSYPCEFCSHIYRSKQAVLKHTERHHADRVRHIKGYKVQTTTGSAASSSSSIEMKGELLEEDQSSMTSNYSSFLASESIETENYYSEAGTSRDSNYETPVTPNYHTSPSAVPLMTTVGYYVPEIANQSYVYQHPYYYYYPVPPKDSQHEVYFQQFQQDDMNLEQPPKHELLLMGGNPATIEKVIDVSSF